jgi:hypothetical protein
LLERQSNLVGEISGYVMSNLKKSLNRERKIQRRRTGMVIDNRSIFTVQEIQKKKSIQIKKEREEKEKMLEGEEE